MKIPNKLKSVKFWVTIWAMIILSFIVFTDKSDFVQLGLVLATAPMAYCITNVKQKEILNKAKGE